jgi:catechol 2,3-dioxygenase-like lactoylglutathione lyase family enzyme
MRHPETGMDGGATGVVFSKTIPILRIFDIDRAHDFYVEYLGFAIDWEHRFSEDGPLYMQVSRGNLVLHLSEHHGDGTPGSAVYIETWGVRDLHAELQAKNYPYLKPGIDVDEIGTCITLLDPFGNTLRLNEPPRLDADPEGPTRAV